MRGTQESMKSAEEALRLVVKAGEDDDELVAKLREKQSFEFRLGDLFRKNNVTAILKM